MTRYLNPSQLFEVRALAVSSLPRRRPRRAARVRRFAPAGRHHRSTSTGPGRAPRTAHPAHPVSAARPMLAAPSVLPVRSAHPVRPAHSARPVHLVLPVRPARPERPVPSLSPVPPVSPVRAVRPGREVLFRALVGLENLGVSA